MIKVRCRISRSHSCQIKTTQVSAFLLEQSKQEEEADAPRQLAQDHFRYQINVTYKATSVMNLEPSGSVTMFTMCTLHQVSHIY